MSLSSSRERPSGSDLINLYNFILCLNWISCRGVVLLLFLFLLLKQVLITVTSDASNKLE